MKNSGKFYSINRYIIFYTYKKKNSTKIKIKINYSSLLKSPGKKKEKKRKDH